MIEYHNPDADTGVESTPYELGTEIENSAAVKVGFLANGFPDSEAFLGELSKAMQAKATGIEILPYNKGNASIPANDEMLADISGDCAAVVAAYGH